ncbi:MAG: hypothetical protein AAF487_14200, partial [Bacteroidota bacterium]
KSSVIMPSIPTDPNPTNQLKILAQLESNLRLEYATADVWTLINRGNDLHEYWRAFYFVLLSFALNRANREQDSKIVKERIPSYFLIS